MTSEAITQKNQIKINRREFLNLAWLASLGIVTAQIGGVTFFFSMPRFKEGEFGGIFTAGSVAQLPETGEAPVNFPKVKIWLSNDEEGLTAIYKVCTHLGCLYNWSSQEGKFLCPCHGSQFELDGTYIKGPAPRSLDRFHVQIVAEDGSVLAETNEAGDPIPVPDNPSALIRVDTGRKIVGKTHA
jgi:cytochrome b6-f complex iron-sulfur subunit